VSKKVILVAMMVMGAAPLARAECSLEQAFAVASGTLLKINQGQGTISNVRSSHDPATGLDRLIGDYRRIFFTYDLARPESDFPMPDGTTTHIPASVETDVLEVGVDGNCQLKDVAGSNVVPVDVGAAR
jgi:hypothetical protein